jgi:uncharacterized protein (TIGR02611 family)
MIKRTVEFTYNTGKRLLIAIAGTSVLLLGVIMLVMPGPAVIVIPIGLAILAIEFVWARNWLKKLREMISRRGAEGRANRAEEHRRP